MRWEEKYTVTSLGLPDRRYKLTQKDKEDIIKLRAEGVTYTAIMKRYNISKGMVYRITHPGFTERIEEGLKKRGGRNKLYYDREQNTIFKRRHFDYIREAVRKLKNK